MAEIAPSGIRAVFDRASELEAEGRSIVRLEIGRPHLGSPAVAVEAAHRSLDAGEVHYTANRGSPNLRAAVAAAVLREQGLEYDPSTEVIVTLGGSEAITAVMLALLEPGDEVLLFEPAWPHYAGLISLAGGRPVALATNAPAHLPDLDRVREALRPSTRMLIVSSPSNPTGSVLEPSVLQGLAELAVDGDLLILSDEIYDRFTYGIEHMSIARMEGARERTIVVNSASKRYSMTGWRVGWALVPAKMAEGVATVHQHIGVCAPSFAQAGVEAALCDGEDFVTSLVREYDERRRELLAALAELPGIDPGTPRGAFYAFPKTEADGTQLARELLEIAGVAVVPGAVFGTGYEHHLRISYGVSAETLQEGISRICAVLG